MSKRRDRDYLSDIHEGMHRISQYISDLTFEQFLKDAKTQDAVVRNLEVIGEATKKLTAHLRKSARHIPWKDLAGVRDKQLPSPEMAIARVRQRVAAGGHNVPEDVIRRRFDAGLRNFSQVYKPLVDEWVLYDNSSDEPVRLEEGHKS